LSHQKYNSSGYIALAITSIGWGTTWVSSKIAVGEMPAFQMASIRQFLGGITLVLFFLLAKKLPLPTFKQFIWLSLMAFLMFVCANGLSTWSLKYIPTGLSALIGALYPLCVVLIEFFFFRNKNINTLTITGLLLGIGGVGIVFYENAFHHRSPNFFLGVGLSAAAMFAWSIGTIVISRNKININPYYATGWQMLISAAILLPMAYATQATQPLIPLQEISAKAWMAIGYLVIMGSIICFAAFVYSMKELPAALFSLYAYFNPLIAMLVAGLLLHEPLTINILWGAIVTLLGVYLVNYSIKRKNEKELAEEE
jgi:drug/metabolite transporter (DMT)-like permease